MCMAHSLILGYGLHEKMEVYVRPEPLLDEPYHTNGVARARSLILAVALHEKGLQAHWHVGVNESVHPLPLVLRLVSRRVS